MNTRKTILLFFLFTLLVILASGYFYFSSVKQLAFQQEHQRAEKLIQSTALLLSAHVEAMQKDTRLLARDKVVQGLYASTDPGALDGVNEQLVSFQKELGAEVCYLMDRNGLTLASSNYRDPTSFVGKNYGFRPYFLEALAGRPSVYLALGVTSGQRGIYLSHPVYADRNKEPVGVAVIKSSIEHYLGEQLKLTSGVIVLANANGFVFAASHPDWQYKFLWRPSREAINETIESHQFGPGPFDWIGLTRKDAGHAVDNRNHISKIHQVPLEAAAGWHVIYFHDLQAVNEAIYGPQLKLIFLIIITICLLASVVTILLYSSTSQDLQRRLLAEQACERSEGELRSLFEKMLEGFALHEIICDEQGQPIDYRFLFVNPAFEAMTGLSSEAIIGKTVLEVMPSTEKHWIDIYGRVALSGEHLHFEEHSSAFDKYFEVTAYRPAMKQFACIFKDISERKKAQDEKIKLEAQLRQALKMEAIGTLAGGIAHDFNNLLAIIIGNAELAQDDIPLDSLARENIEYILHASKRARDLVRQILSFSRRDNQELQAIEPQTVIKESVKLLRSIIPSTVEIHETIDPACGTIIADPTQIHQVVMNLATNAVHAMQERGTLEISLSQVVLTEKELGQREDMLPGAYVLLTVGDSGTGINREIIDRIFDPFYTTKDVGQGTGMGLSVVLGIIMAHHGMIQVDSEMGWGSVFRCYFAVAEPEEISFAAQMKELPRGNERVLFVDDEELLAEMGRSILARLGYDVTVRMSSIGALEVFQAAPDDFDIVITDHTMPEMTGAELAAKMLKIRPDLPVILCTGYSSSVSAEAALEIGIRKFCMKPLDRMQLADMVRKVLDENKKI